MPGSAIENENEHNEHCGTTTTSRLRKFDKQLLDQAAPTSYMDEDDQIEYIHTLNLYNLQQYMLYMRWVMYLYTVEIIATIATQLVAKEAHIVNLLFLLGICLNIICIIQLPRDLIKFKKWIVVVTAVITLQVAWIDVVVQPRYYMAGLSLVNFVMPRLFQRWFESVGESVEQLNGLKYKYKNV
ncbi:uncharacterized protein LODBEIA_P01820 [Lodderomyces beijingensis]|uniref:Uncharacterized protein n=1 Tax=Lodderomyces beijingensis TaxID=1775926 RepID=A0ABP0ZEF0_9ASCO